MLTTSTSPTPLAPPGGITAGAAESRLRDEGPNTVSSAPADRLVQRIARQLTDPLVALLLAAAVVTTALGDYPDTAVIALVVLVNTAIGVWQEVRADRAVAALDRLAAPTARVVRDGADLIVPAAEVVRGDRVRLAAGDIVPADVALDDAHRLRLDESAMTGEAHPVDRTAGEDAHAGTVVLTGRGTGTVVRVGSASALGRIVTLVRSTRPVPTPLQRRLAQLGRLLGAVAVVTSAAVFALGLATGRGVVEMAITAVSLVVAAVPESMPAVVTLALALGARRMARARAIPRRLQSVETLGSVTVIASDKTGTLTEGRMAVQEAMTAVGHGYVVHGQGYAPEGSVVRDGVEVSPDGDLVELARAGLLCNDAALSAPDAEHPEWTAVGDPLEAALLAFAARCGLDPALERAAWPRVAEQPFEQARRRMTTVHGAPGGGYLVVCKGAPESVLSAPVVTAGDPELRVAAERLANQGLRVLAVAAAVTDRRPDPRHPTGLRPLGLVAVGDPVRSGARDSARVFARAGVRLILITGDHPATAGAIGSHLGLLTSGDRVVCGDAETVGGETAARTNVYARTQPEQKLDIIAALQDRGEVVAMTGDGVNDAPALRRADIGVAMGGGTEVARQAADLVLVDDNLATMIHAIEEGRRIYDNVRRFLRYGLAGGLAEILVMLVGPFLGLAVPLLPAQILWVNLLTHGLPGVALGAEPAEPGALERPPRSPRESVLGRGLARAVVAGAVAIAIAVLGAGLVAFHSGRPWQSMVFVVLGLAQLGVALAVRARRTPGGPTNHGLLAAVALSAVLQIAGVLVPGLRDLLGTEPLSALDLLLCAGFAIMPGVAVHLTGRATARARPSLTVRPEDR